MNTKRRDFLKASTTLISGLALTSITGKLTACNSVSKSPATADGKPFGLQLYSLRDDMPKDPKGVLKQVASFGYKQVESYEHSTMGMYWGMKNTEFKQYMDELGMKIVSSHTDINKDFERKAAEAAAIGMEYLICPYLGPQKSMDFFKKTAAQFNTCGGICKKNGLRFAYHNHDYSFKPLKGELPQDVMMTNTDKNLVDFQMDIYWVVTAGQDPIAWLNKYPGRFKLAHIKDRIKNAPLSETSASTTPGTGSIDFPKILATGIPQGFAYFIVEQERYDGTTPLKAAKDGAAYMKGLKLTV